MPRPVVARGGIGFSATSLRITWLNSEKVIDLSLRKMRGGWHYGDDRVRKEGDFRLQRGVFQWGGGRRHGSNLVPPRNRKAITSRGPAL